eukprot:361678-Chlamydomonas_euryale.AAC.3
MANARSMQCVSMPAALTPSPVGAKERRRHASLTHFPLKISQNHPHPHTCVPPFSADPDDLGISYCWHPGISREPVVGTFVLTTGALGNCHRPHLPPAGRGRAGD